MYNFFFLLLQILLLLSPASIFSLAVQFADLQADQEETQRSLQQAKKKCQRLVAELQDTKLHLENQQSRNHELEKKQRK